MAVAERKSTNITNRDATPRVLSNGGALAGVLRYAVGTLETVATDDIASIYRMFSVPSNAVMASLRIYSDDIGSSAAAADIGIYRTTEDGGAVVDADVFASAVVLNAGALNGVDILNESAVTAWGLEDAEKKLWEAVGLSADPGVLYDVCFTATGAIDAVATLTLRCTYAL